MFLTLPGAPDTCPRLLTCNLENGSQRPLLRDFRGRRGGGLSYLMGVNTSKFEFSTTYLPVNITGVENSYFGISNYYFPPNSLAGRKTQICGQDAHEKTLLSESARRLSLKCHFFVFSVRQL